MGETVPEAHFDSAGRVPGAERLLCNVTAVGHWASHLFL